MLEMEQEQSLLKNEKKTCRLLQHGCWIPTVLTWCLLTVKFRFRHTQHAHRKFADRVTKESTNHCWDKLRIIFMFHSCSVFIGEVNNNKRMP